MILPVVNHIYLFLFIVRLCLSQETTCEFKEGCGSHINKHDSFAAYDPHLQKRGFFSCLMCN